VSPSGEVSSARAVSGHALLQQVSVLAGTRWKFAPVRDGERVRLVRVVFTFRQRGTAGNAKESTGVLFLSPYQAVIHQTAMTVEYSYSYSAAVSN